MCTYVMNFNTQVPGRLGLLVTLHLIVTNVYNSVKAPTKRGFSFIEIWMIGTQIPILLALYEYGFILYLKKTIKNGEDQVETMDQNDSGQTLDEKIKKLDYASMMISLFSFTIFVLVYCIIAQKLST